jgi:hypothetical protein
MSTIIQDNVASDVGQITAEILAIYNARDDDRKAQLLDHIEQRAAATA